MYFLRSIASRTVGSFDDRSTRRSATVTISAPDAASAARVSSSEAYLPVPTMMRDESVRPARVQVSFISASSDEGDELETITCEDHRRRVIRPRDDLAIALDGNSAIAEPQLSEQYGYGRAVFDFLRLSVDDYVDARRHRAGNYHRCMWERVPQRIARPQ